MSRPRVQPIDQSSFAGDWWEIARLYSAGSEGCSSSETGLESKNFTGHALKWVFILKNVDYYSTSLSVYTLDAKTLQSVYPGIALVSGGNKLSFALSDNGRTVELGVFTLLQTDYTSLAILGRVSIPSATSATTVSKTRQTTQSIVTESSSTTTTIQQCQETELIVLSRRPQITKIERDTMLLTAERFGYDGSRLVTSRPIVVVPIAAGVAPLQPTSYSYVATEPSFVPLSTARGTTRIISQGPAYTT